MSVITVYAIRDLIAGLDLSSRVTAYSDDGTNTTITVGNVFNAREGLVVDVDGMDYTVVSVNYETNTLVLSGVIALPVLLTVPNPFFFHGTYRKVNGELNEILSIDDKVPMAYLHEILENDRPNKYSGLEVTSSILLFLLDKAPENGGTTTEQYAEIIEPLERLYDAIRSAIDNSFKFGDVDGWNDRPRIELGIYDDNKGNLRRLLDAQLSGIAIRFRLPILKCCK